MVTYVSYLDLEQQLIARKEDITPSVMDVGELVIWVVKCDPGVLLG